MRQFLAALFLVIIVGSSAFAENEFKINNPDIKKYEFARSYITALSYLKRIDDRWFNKAPKKIYPNQDEKIIKLSMDYLIMDNTDLRIAKNYMIPYLSAQNALIRKVADNFVLAVDEEIAVNNQHKIAWQQWAYLKKEGRATPVNERDFIKAHQQYGLRFKEADKKVVQATILMAKVLISDQNKDERGRLLAITSAQRDKLLLKLDSFAKDAIAWGIKPGQRTLEASIAIIREVLEDSVWISLDEK